MTPGEDRDFGMSGAGTEQRLDSLEKHAVSADNRLVQLSRDVAGLSATVSAIAADMKSIAGVVMKVESAPKFDVLKTLTFVGITVGIFGGVASGIIYIASNVNAPMMARYEERIAFQRERLDKGWFTPSAMQIRSATGTVTPQ